MKRREFIAALGGAAAWPIAAGGQQRAMPIVGWIRPGTPNQAPHLADALRQGMAEIGFAEGQNVVIESRFAENQNDRFQALADDLVRAQVDVIVVPASTTGALAAQKATKTIPIVFMIGSDPVEIGLVASFSRPGGNMTGIGQLQAQTATKRVQMLHELVSTADTLGWLIDPTNRYALAEAREVQAAAKTLRLDLRILNASTVSEINTAFETLTQQKIGALVVGADAFFFNQRDRIIKLATQHTLPTISNYREYAVAGGLMSYGNNVADAYRLVGNYVGRILKGEKAAEMPVQQPTKFEFVINLGAAKALGLMIPDKLLALADEVIE